MPYIPQKAREQLDSGVRDPESVGELTYVITRTVDQYLGADPRFQTFADVIAALQCTQLELYRRVVAPYETVKQGENGDVYVNRTH